MNLIWNLAYNRVNLNIKASLQKMSETATIVGAGGSFITGKLHFLKRRFSHLDAATHLHDFCA
jgi:hypothetical protein